MLLGKTYEQFLIPFGENNDGLYSRCEGAGKTHAIRYKLFCTG